MNSGIDAPFLDNDWQIHFLEQASFLEHLEHGLPHGRRRLHHRYPCLPESLDLVLGRTLPARDNGCKTAHDASRMSSLS